MSVTGEAALRYTEMGWPVFPVWWVRDDGSCACGRACEKNAGKHPVLRHGLNGATTDVALISHWWEKVPRANVAVRTGVLFDVLDIDSPAANHELGELAIRQGETYPDCWGWGPMSRTARGSHLWYQPTGSGNRTRLCGITGIDWRGSGGYVLLPPSVHRTGHVYTWHEDCPPDAPLPAAPSFLRAALTALPAPVVSHRPQAAPTALLGTCSTGGLARTVASAPEGSRNQVLNWAAYKLGCDHRSGRVSGDVLVRAIDDLHDAALNAGLTEKEIASTIRSGLKGRQNV